MIMKAAVVEAEKGRSLWQDAFQRLLKNKMAVIGFCYLIVQASLAVLAPWIASFPFEETDLLLGAVAPDSVHYFGTDALGRDMFTRVLHGARISLMVGILATAVSLAIGVLYGSISGYMGGRVDNIMMRLLEILYALPFTFFVIILMVLFGRNIYLLFIALGAIQWLTMARIVRGQVVSLKKMEYVDAARSMGVGHVRIIASHLIPNVLGTVIVYVTLTVPNVILEEAFLSFLGLGVQEPMASWGTLISDGVGAMQTYPWMLIIPCASLMLTLLALNFLGDGLRDALDPQASKD
ncbi:MAG: ABC transporter permease subunit [Deltaproteobacteria bacterium]|nr:ABC transporter permease subunit [Deltaproteobacteria bacterium]